MQCCTRSCQWTLPSSRGPGRRSAGPCTVCRYAIRPLALRGDSVQAFVSLPRLEFPHGRRRPPARFRPPGSLSFRLRCRAPREQYRHGNRCLAGPTPIRLRAAFLPRSPAPRFTGMRLGPAATDIGPVAGTASYRRSANRHDNQTRCPLVSTTGSPSSFLNAPRCGCGRMSSTVSEGRHSFVPSGVTTMGRFISTGYCPMKSSN